MAPSPANANASAGLIQEPQELVDEPDSHGEKHTANSFLAPLPFRTPSASWLRCSPWRVESYIMAYCARKRKSGFVGDSATRPSTPNQTEPQHPQTCRFRKTSSGLSTCSSKSSLETSMATTAKAIDSTRTICCAFDRGSMTSHDTSSLGRTVPMKKK